MGAYNGVNGFFCCENPFLLQQVLKKEWGFTGLLMSDYNAIHDGLSAALNGCDLDLPAGNFMNSKNLSPFTPAPLTIATIDDKVRRILREVVSFGFLDRQQLDPTIWLNSNKGTKSLTARDSGIVGCSLDADSLDNLLIRLLDRVQ